MCGFHGRGAFIRQGAFVREGRLIQICQLRGLLIRQAAFIRERAFIKSFTVPHLPEIIMGYHITVTKDGRGITKIRVDCEICKMSSHIQDKFKLFCMSVFL